MYKVIKLAFIFVLYITQSQLASSQVNISHLKPLLIKSDQKTLDKIEVVFNKGKNLENEANILNSTGDTDKEKAKNEKKYTLKRLEAAQFYQKANADLLALFKDNINKFWKENKNSKINPSIKNFEDKANEIARSAKSTRNVAEDIAYPNEKLSKILEAEKLESEAINIFTKVLYAYLNYPITYDSIKEGDENAKTDTLSITKNATNTNILPAPKAEKKDSIVISSPAVKDTIKPQVTAKTNKAQETPLLVTKQAETPVVQKMAPKDTGSLYNMMEVEEEQVDQFNKFLEEKYPNKFENYVINFRELNYGDFDSLRSAWTRYNQYQFTPEEIASLKKKKGDSTELIAAASADTSVKQQEPAIVISEQKNIAQNKETVKPVTEKATNKHGDKKSTPKQTSTAAKKEKPTEATAVQAEPTIVQKQAEDAIAQGFIYRVQIVACRIQVDSKSLKNIYRGGMKIIELNEDNWYKYAIGEYKTYAEARHLRDALKIPGAFVIAYLNGKRIQILNTNISQNTIINSNDVENLVYKVQIAAAKNPLNKKYIQHIYSGVEKVEENFEDGWYKYSIITGPSLAAAKKFVETEDIPGAFITSYLGNKKIDLKDALKLSKIKKQ